jgi:two-component system, NarL family, response regulator DevR
LASVTAGEERIGVFLLDDHEVVRRGLRQVLTAESDIAVVGDDGAVKSALPRILDLRPDVAVLDVRLPDGDGISLPRDPVQATGDRVPHADGIRG